MVPVDEADEADDEESLGDVCLRLAMPSSSFSSCSTIWSGSGGRRWSWALAKDLCKSLIFHQAASSTDKAAQGKNDDKANGMTRDGRMAASG